MKRSVTLSALAAVVVAVAVVGIYQVRLSMKDAERAEACYAQLGKVLQSGVDPTIIYQQKLGELQTLVEQSLVARSEMLVVANRLRVDKDAPLSSRDLVTLKSGTEAYLNMRERLYDIANAYECAIDADETL
ncbi:MAG: hypothetical protein OEY37_11530, partial [Gammaproteobacteria bacterium]|nr:hypothetical protein [Gammaproteobacteria bacterium]